MRSEGVAGTLAPSDPENPGIPGRFHRQGDGRRARPVCPGKRVSFRAGPHLWV